MADGGGREVQSSLLGCEGLSLSHVWDLFFHVTRADECGLKRRLRASPPREGPCWVQVWGRRARTPRGQVHSNPTVDGACESRRGDSARVSCLQLAKIGT